ncbi:MAG: serine protease [Proteobacteria bacterium]|nr:serine protease [Pseudomonadota bacterium]
MKKQILITLAVGLLLPLASGPAFSDQEADVGRKIQKKWQEVVVTVKIVNRVRMVVEGREANKAENKTEAIATVIDPSGLAVLPLSVTDPTRIANLFSEAQGRGEDSPHSNYESELSDLKMVLPDGKEVPAQVILRDKDLDLTFIRPTAKLEKPLLALDLTQSAAPDILDPVFVLTRLGKVASYSPSVSLLRIQSIMKKPRTFFIPDFYVDETGLGAPIFTQEGKVIGILTLRIFVTPGGGMSNILGGASGMGIIPVILPAADVAEVAKQAPKQAEKSEKPEDKSGKDKK